MQYPITVLQWLAVLILISTGIINVASTSSDTPNLDEFEDQNLGSIVTQLLKRSNGAQLSYHPRPQIYRHHGSSNSSNTSQIETIRFRNRNQNYTNSTQQSIMHPAVQVTRLPPAQNNSLVSAYFLNATRETPTPVQIPIPVVRNNLTNQTRIRTSNSSVVLPRPIIGARNNVTTSQQPPIETQVHLPPTDIPAESETEIIEISDDDEGEIEGSPEIYKRKLNSVLQNIQQILPILTILQHNMTDLLNNSKGKIGQEPVVDTSIESEIRASPLTATEQHTEGIESTTQEFSFPLPTVTLLADEENPEYIHHIIDELYPKGSFENLIKVVKTMPPKSQIIAFEKIADDIVEALQTEDGSNNAQNNKYGKASFTKHDVGDLIGLSCELFGKSRFQQIIDKHSIFESFAFPTFFRGEKEVYLEAQTKTDGFKNLYFDRRNQVFGITNEPARGVFQSWSFFPVNDGCYFMLQSFDADFIVGVVVTKSAASPLLAKNVLGIAGQEDGKTNYRFHWKIITYRDPGTDHALLLLENRETNLVLEWGEDGSVQLNSNNFEKNQLWDQGQRFV